MPTRLKKTGGRSGPNPAAIKRWGMWKSGFWRKVKIRATGAGGRLTKISIIDIMKRKVEMKRTLFVAAVVLVVSSMVYADAPAGIHGYCYYCIEGENPTLADSVDLFLKRTADNYIFTGNSAKNDPTQYVANNTYGVDVYIDAGYWYYVKGKKVNYTGDFKGIWEMQYAGPHNYEDPNNNPVQHIYLIKTGDIPDD